MDFQIGEKIIYPTHGAGIIESIEEKEILGTKQLYYMLSINKIQVMFPMTTNIGIRRVVDSTTMDDVLASFHEEESEETHPNRTQRYRIHVKMIKSGNIYEGAQVIRDLLKMKKKRALASVDKRLLDNAQEILISELMLVKGIDQLEAVEMLNSAICINE
ncbi:CarD family transcriptional regulator [Anaerobacillus alkaliphilus]|uniref:CarD family transcriptional regulator n=1 Tax=Anaerobacillus alkaliphilus TaxID=1548597 RepID=A0A4Q0VMQ1_9BACI|nr:CarD family transcriptional regulator [Anaerobacillus alkaliphilus]RXI96403.1 CarD family transcriptional regulator [Anaerobacillus alkaliphilus]